MKKKICIFVQSNFVQTEITNRKDEKESQILPVNPVYESITDTTKWSYIYFGSYPQTQLISMMLCVLQRNI